MQKIYPNTIAALTAGLNNVQYQLLRFYCDNIIVFFDSDKTGDKGRDKAMARNQEGSVDLMTKQNVRSICLQSSSGFQGYKDPAKYLEMFGLKAFKNYMSKQIDSVPPFLI